jgi:hypothetical protein
METQPHVCVIDWFGVSCRWADEFHPGQDDPGRTVYHTVAKEIPPGGSARFTHTPSPPLQARRDGEFVIDVKVAGFERVYYR